ncbi:DUF397 domain-containing protein [Streptomyces sp. UNOC14_S4]|uniref:DUF397 domain-containing protein n=1 Tax=Streptomyces sp. UNOC14_S4 TaxID=2872340 RepID=UPI001E611CD6|nr:DUF397 domain-containing protein [Streptomyces sp. UNOC14_S4]MCC3770552.1 DUF397 domain-containing protein [Streptomyces sp. UNOC14_S4]
MTTSARPTALDVADESAWFKSSHSGDNGGGGCISITALTSRIGIRDSKHPNGPAFVVPDAAWSSLIHEIRSERT